MKTLMRQGAVGALLFAMVGCLVPIGAIAQDSPAKRKLVQQSAPAYPPLARSMALQGVVRLDVQVEADGSVKDVAIRGGHPILAQAAVNTVRRWRWEPASHESRESVEVKFMPAD